MSEQVPENMVPIPIQEYVSGVPAPTEFHVRLAENQYAMVLRTGEKADRQTLSNYKGLEIDYLWVRREDYGKISQQNIMIAGIVVANESLSAKQKTHVVTAAAKSVFKEFDHMGISIDMFNHARQVSEATVALVEKQTSLAQLFESLNECSDVLLRHSMAVSALSIIIGCKLKWENKMTLEKLGLGGLLHDIGLKTLPPDLLRKPKLEMTVEELQVWETHPFRGVQLLSSLPIVPDDVVAIVYEHHENAIGQGFPRRLRNVKMHPLARVVALANQFVNLTIQNVDNPVPRTPREAIMYIDNTMGQPFCSQCFRALAAIVSNQEIPDVA